MKSITFHIAIILAFLTSCQTPTQQAPNASLTPTPKWSDDAVIYEVNVRQFTSEGTFKAFLEHLPELKELGVDILWFMPIHPIGEENRKGTLGSYYSIKDYKGVNPEFGTFEDFKNLVDLAHSLQMKVILDWVANHTAWDHPWITETPDWYDRDESGNMFAPFDWTDVAQLDYSNKEMRAAMIDALEFWVREANIDGYRCDVAGLVPVDFWEDARLALEKIKPVYMLAEDESETSLLNKAFNSNYGWSFHHIMNNIAKETDNVNSIKEYITNQQNTYPIGTYPMHFITNHDENSWASTEFERMGDAVKTFATLSFVMDGMPLIYSGQEVGFNRMLEFFEKDIIDRDDELNMFEFYKSLIYLKKSNAALWNGNAGGKTEILEINNPENLLLMKREKGNNIVVSLFNFSSVSSEASIPSGISGEFTEFFSQEQISLSPSHITLEPWEFKIYTSRQ